MGRSILFAIPVAAAFAAAVCAPVPCQTVNDTSSSASAPQGKTTPASLRLKPWFSDNTDPQRPHSIEFRTFEQMTGPDRLQAANAESSIAEHTRYAGLEFNQGQWSYRQVVCPALPNHIFLRFLRNNGAGDVSLFTASIPRGQDGRVRIIPIQLRGYSLFSPAPINALTISAFNHIRAEEDPGKDPDWLGTGLCYAALAGGHPQTATLNDNPAAERFPVATVASLDLASDGGAVIAFSDVSASPRPMRWSMTFDRKGKLVKAGHAPEDILKVSVEHPHLVDQVGKPQPMKSPKVRSYNPPTQGVVTQDPTSPAPSASQPQ